ncbi:MULTISPECIES: hypothetical protein [unclassified Exiguobacterium]|uniref:hypothetical protein n=1 Tax=unclassified Exiguobacterium TaxID=2644629 RepID=UPI001BEB8009|nr:MULTISPECIES: hypothetical protein [unclassified Exiguobacterium]
MKNMIQRAKFVCGGEEGATTTEYIMILAVALLIAIPLFLFGSEIQEFLFGSADSVDKLDKANTNFNPSGL